MKSPRSETLHVSPLQEGARQDSRWSRRVSRANPPVHVHHTYSPIGTPRGDAGDAPGLQPSPLQDASRMSGLTEIAPVSYTAPALWRFRRRIMGNLRKTD